MNIKSMNTEQAIKADYAKPELTELNFQKTAGGTAGMQELNPDGMNTNRKDQGTS